MLPKEILATFFLFIYTHGALLRGILAAVLILFAVFGTRLLRTLLAFIRRHTSRFAPEWLQILNEGFERPLLLVLRSVLIFFAVIAMPLPFPAGQVWRVSSTLLTALITILIAWGLWRSASLCGLLFRSAENRLDLESNKTMIRFFEKIYRALIVLFAALIVLDLFGVPVTGLLTGAGIAGLAISLAAQSTLSNLIAGITLVLERPFGIGDYVVLGSMEGTVEEISFRSTRLRTPDKVLITVENSKVCAEYIQNMTGRTNRLWEFTIGVTYDTSREKIEQLTADLVALLQADPLVQPGSAQVVLANFSASSIDLNVRVYVTALALDEFRALKNRMNLAIMDLMARDGCEFAFPSTTVYLENNDSQH